MFSYLDTGFRFKDPELVWSKLFKTNPPKMCMGQVFMLDGWMGGTLLDKSLHFKVNLALLYKVVHITLLYMCGAMSWWLRHFKWGHEVRIPWPSFGGGDVPKVP